MREHAAALSCATKYAARKPGRLDCRRRGHFADSAAAPEAGPETRRPCVKEGAAVGSSRVLALSFSGGSRVASWAGWRHRRQADTGGRHCVCGPRVRAGRGEPPPRVVLLFFTLPDNRCAAPPCLRPVRRGGGIAPLREPTSTPDRCLRTWLPTTRSAGFLLAEFEAGNCVEGYSQRRSTYLLAGVLAIFTSSLF